MIIDRLIQIFNNVNDWLKFAEAKVGALIAFLAATIFGSFQVCNGAQCNDFISFYIGGIIVFASIALFICLISLMPQTRLKWLWPPEKYSKTDNLFFFGHLAKYDADSLVELLIDKYKLESDNKEMELDIANQIIQNSLIANKKYKYFNFSMMVIISGIIGLPVIYLATIILNKFIGR